MKYWVLIIGFIISQSIWADSEDDYLALIEAEAQVAVVQERTEWQTWQQSSVANHLMRRLSQADAHLYEEYLKLPEKHQVAILKAFEKGTSINDIRFLILGHKQLVVIR